MRQRVGDQLVIASLLGEGETAILVGGDLLPDNRLALFVAFLLISDSLLFLSQVPLGDVDVAVLESRVSEHKHEGEQDADEIGLWAPGKHSKGAKLLRRCKKVGYHP